MKRFQDVQEQNQCTSWSLLERTTFILPIRKKHALSKILTLQTFHKPNQSLQKNSKDFKNLIFMTKKLYDLDQNSLRKDLKKFLVRIRLQLKATLIHQHKMMRTIFMDIQNTVHQHIILQSENQWWNWVPQWRESIKMTIKVNMKILSKWLRWANTKVLLKRRKTKHLQSFIAKLTCFQIKKEDLMMNWMSMKLMREQDLTTVKTSDN